MFNLKKFIQNIKQWNTRTPAPALSVDDAQVIEEMAGAIAASYFIAREGGYRIMSQGDATEAAKAALESKVK